MTQLLRNDPAVLALLAASVLFFVLLVLVVAIFLLAHHRLSATRERQLYKDIRAAARFLATGLLDRSGAAAAIRQAQETWGTTAVETVLRRIRQALKGELAEAASRGLEVMGTVTSLAVLASSGSVARRARALRLLGHCGGKQARTVLLAALEDPEPEVRRAAREALPAIRDERSLRAALTSYLRDPAQRTAWRMGFFAMIAAQIPDSLRTLSGLGAFDESDEKLALEALAEVGDARSLRLAVARLDAPSVETRVTAVRAVGKLQDHQTAHLLIPKLADPEWIVRAAAARALGTSPCSSLACRALGASLRDSVWWVRTNAARALSLLGEAGVLTLMEALGGHDDFARQSALAALARIDPRDRTAIALQSSYSRRGAA